MFSADYFLGRGKTFAALQKVNQKRSYVGDRVCVLTLLRLKYDEAMKDFDRVLELQPNSKEAEEERAAVLKKVSH